MQITLKHSKIDDGALGRNGIMSTTALVLTSFYEDSVSLSVENSRGDIGRVWIAIPRAEIPALIRALKEVKVRKPVGA